MCTGREGSVRPRGHISDLQLNYKIRHNSGYSEQTKEHEKTQKCCKSSDFVCASKEETRAGFPSFVPGGLLVGVRARVGAAQ